MGVTAYTVTAVICKWLLLCPRMGKLSIYVTQAAEVNWDVQGERQ